MTDSQSIDSLFQVSKKFNQSFCIPDMDFEELVAERIEALPLDYKNYDYFHDFVNEKLDEHLLEIEGVTSFPYAPGLNNDRNFIMETQKGVVKNLKNLFNNYFNGSPSKAYGSLKKALKGSGKSFDELFKMHTYGLGESFYRVRLMDDNYQLKPEQLFHMPFELRGNVLSQRYSIAGVPSLYLGRTIYVCWEELGRPKLDAFHALRLQNTKDIRLIDLTHPHKNDVKSKFSFLLTWPFIALSSVKVKNQEHNFKPEYILPQLLLEWVKANSNVDGIRFISTKVKYSWNQPVGEIYNIVLPAKQIANSGYCEGLISMFESTNPTSAQIIDISNGGITVGYNQSELEYLDKRLPFLEIAKGKTIPYSHSKLARLELNLDHAPAHQLTNNQ